MRIVMLLAVSLLTGAAGFGAWVYFGSDPGSSPGTVSPPTKNEKWRYAPYVVLVPAKPLPDQVASEPPPLPERKASNAPALQPAAPPAAEAPRPPTDAAPESPAAPSRIAQQTLEAISNAVQEPPAQAQDTKPSLAAAPPPEPPAPEKPEVKQLPVASPPRKEPAPEPVQQRAETGARQKTVDKPRASQNQVARQAESKTLTRGETKLKYEVETDREAKAREAQKSLLAQGKVRFRRIIPIGPGLFKAGENTVALAGVDALEANAECTYSTGAKWDCGRWGTFALRRFIRRRSVVCDLISEIAPSELSGRCTVGGTDISKWIVRRGWGTPTEETRETYASDLEAAKREKLGQWSEAPKSDS